MTSVAVVRMTLEVWAGSMPICFMSRGLEAPESHAQMRLTSMSRADDEPQVGAFVPDPGPNRRDEPDDDAVDGAESPPL